jgi:hypothetical protein
VVQPHPSLYHVQMTGMLNMQSISSFVSLGKQELLTLLESSVPVLVWFVLLGLHFLCSVLFIIVCPIAFFVLTIVLSVLRATDSDYSFVIGKFSNYTVNSLRNMSLASSNSNFGGSTSSLSLSFTEYRYVTHAINQ